LRPAARIIVAPPESSSLASYSCSAHDFPHREGGRDPVRRFARALEDYNIAEDKRERFQTTNFNQLPGSHA
jgi:hypothetical protein